MPIIVTHRQSPAITFVYYTLISYYPYSYFILYRQCEFLIFILISDTIMIINIVSTIMEPEIIL